MHPSLALGTSQDIDGKDPEPHGRPGDPAPPDAPRGLRLPVGEAVAAEIGVLVFKGCRHTP